MVRGFSGVLFGVMLVLGFSRPHAAPPKARTLSVAITCFWSQDPERQCLASTPWPLDSRG
jgi:hypothetical protein